MERAEAGIAIAEAAQARNVVGDDADDVELRFDVLSQIHFLCEPVCTIIRVDDQEVYGLIGEDGFTQLIAAFYRRVAGDDILGPMYPKHDLAGAEERLREFLVFRFGGPATYLEKRGHPRLRMRHGPFAIDRAARNRWMELMEASMAEAALPAEAEQVLRAFFDSTATFMINRG